MSRKSKEWTSNKIRKLLREGKARDQAIAEALSMAGRSNKKKAK